MTEKEFQELKINFDKVIQSSQKIDVPMTWELLKNWEEAKSEFIKNFGGLIYEHPEKIQFGLTEEAKKEKYEKFIEFLYYYFHNDEAIRFLERQGFNAFFDNLTVESFTTSSGKEIKKGTKLIKAFKHIINNTTDLETIQNKASRIIQEDKIEGTLCLSVHPLDYLSISETIYNWRSCHSLDGEYRAGNLSYMLDSCTVVCYLKSDKEVELPNFPGDVLWNAKKWRVLLFLSEDKNMIFAGKQYPFEAKDSLNRILKEVLPATGMLKFNENPKYTWSPWNECIRPVVNMEDYDLELNDSYVPFGGFKGKIKPISEVINNVPGSKHFNDLLNSSTYKPLYTTLVYTPSFGEPEIIAEENRTKFNIGGKTMCLRCGEHEVYGGADTMLCERCELEYGNTENDLIGFCAHCDTRIYLDDGYYVDGEIICADCFSDLTVICENCGEDFYTEDTYYDEETNGYYCYCCYKDLLAERKESEGVA
jgi:hypothetical protein